MTNGDGSVNVEGTTESLIVRDAETGAIEMIDPHAIISVEAVDNSQLKVENSQATPSPLRGTPPETLLGGELGSTSPMQDTPISGGVAGGDLTSQSQSPVYALNDEVTLRDDEGNIIHGQIAEYYESDDSFVLDVDKPINGKYAPKLTRAELESMIVEQGEPTVKPIEATGAESTAQTGSESDGSNGTDEAVNASSEVEPVGVGKFGEIYDQFKGKVKEAVAFLFKKRGGEAKDVFYREEIGNIGLIWGDDKQGLRHIEKRHIEQQDDFNSIEELTSVLDDVISTGDLRLEGNNAVIEKGNYRAVIAQDENGNWVLTAYDYVRGKKEKEKEKEKGSAAIVTPGQTNEGAGAVTPNLSRGEDSENNSDMQEGGVDKVSEDNIELK